QGERVILFLDTRPDGSLRVHEMFLGKFSIVEDPKTGKLVAARSAPFAHIDLLDKDTHSASDKTYTDQMELSAYIRMIRNKVAANEEQSQQFEQTYYTGVPMLARPSEFDGKNGRGELQPQFTLIAPSTPPRWFEPDSGQPVVFYINQDQAPNPQIFD